MSDSTSLRDAAHAAYLAYCEQQARMRAIEWRDRVRRANKELEERLGLESADWQVAEHPAPVKLVCTIEGITLGADFDEGEAYLRVHVLNEEGDMYWPVVYDLAELGKYLAENEENREHFKQLVGEEVLARITGETANEPR